MYGVAGHYPDLLYHWCSASTVVEWYGAFRWCSTEETCTFNWVWRVWLINPKRLNHFTPISNCQCKFLMFLGLLWTRIDLLLGGGLRAGQLTELVGPSSSGKTQVSNSLGQKLYKLMIAMIWIFSLHVRVFYWGFVFITYLRTLLCLLLDQFVNKLDKFMMAIISVFQFACHISFIWVLLSLLKNISTLLCLLCDHLKRHLSITDSIFYFRNAMRNYMILRYRQYTTLRTESVCQFLVTFRFAYLLPHILYQSTWVQLYTWTQATLSPPNELHSLLVESLTAWVIRLYDFLLVEFLCFICCS